jgi:hypothetical protein
LVRLIKEINSANRKWADRMLKWIVRGIMPRVINNICRIFLAKHYNKPDKYYLIYCYIVFKMIFILTRLI